jgi:hypothetical protein
MQNPRRKNVRHETSGTFRKTEGISERGKLMRLMQTITKKITET